MKILLTGGTGLLGKKILEKFDYEFILLKREKCDLSKPYEIEVFLKKLPPVDGIWHIAAYTDVERAETDETNCFLVNWISTKILSDFSLKKDIRILYISTDYVFDGKKKKPYREWDKTNPLNIYGKSKLFGEKEVLKNKDALIIRTSWLYGEHGKNFVTKIIEKSKKEKKLKIVRDQCGSPTYTEDLADTIKKLWEREERGIFHFSNKGEITWFEFAKEIFKILNIKIEIEPSLSEDLNLKAKRPSYSVLDTFLIEKKLGIKIKHWKTSLREFLKKI